MNFLGDDGVVVGGRSVEFDAGGRFTVTGNMPGSFVSVDFGVLLDVSAVSFYFIGIFEKLINLLIE